MRAKNALSIIALILVTLTNGITASAQETVPDTPPELRDFRLDQPRPQPQAETQAQPTAEPTASAPPPVVATRPETRQVGPIRRAQSQTETARQDRAKVDTIPAEPPEMVRSEATTSEEEAVPAPENEVAPVVAEPTTPDVKSAEPTLSYGQIAAALAAVAGLAAIAWLFRRRRAKPDEQFIAPLPAIGPDPASDVIPVMVPVAKAVPKTRQQPDIKIEFVPEKATITFASLTIKGQLQICNDGQADAKNMELRAGLISASHQQQEAIDLFFSTSQDITPNVLGGAKAGERMAVALELSVPLSEMHSFPLGDQRLLVPIILATMQYHGEDAVKPLRAEMAYMIGREATPPKPKMGPLRLDLGPRSFSPLGTRPLNT